MFVELLRVAHPLTSGAVAVLIEEQDFELPYDLSPREFDILHGVARGHTNQRIASTRAISLRTVTTHIERILHKMNQESRAGAIGVALKEGFLRIDD